MTDHSLTYEAIADDAGNPGHLARCACKWWQVWVSAMVADGNAESIILGRYAWHVANQGTSR